MSQKKQEKPASTAGLPADAGFDELLQSLEQVVARMESGELPLEEALREFERGQQLAQACQQRLEKATLKVRNLLAAAEDEDDEGGTGR